jgi:hypothetical protein
MKQIILILLVIAFAKNLSAQREVEKFSVDFSEEKHEQIFKERLDTNYYYLIFEIGFENDTINVVTDNKIFFSGRITTDDGTGSAKFLKVLKRDIDQLYLNVNNSKDLHIPLTNYHFILVSFQGYYEILINYSFFLPAYM